MNVKLSINWSARAKADVKNIYIDLLKKNSKAVSQKIRNEIINAPTLIVFPEQYQADEYLNECRRIIIRNYKILYTVVANTITIISVFNSHRNPSKMRGIL